MWNLFIKPYDVNVLCSLLNFRHTDHSDGSIKRHKVYFVSNGTFALTVKNYSPVVKPTTIRIFFSLTLS